MVLCVLTVVVDIKCAEFARDNVVVVCVMALDYVGIGMAWHRSAESN